MPAKLEKLECCGSARPMSVGVAALDSDHRCLGRIVDLLVGLEDETAVAALIPTVLDTVSLYAAFHFQREERVMTAVGYPEAFIHRREHRDAVHWFDRLRCTYDGARSTGAAVQLWQDLAGWLRHHVLIQDMAYKPYVVDAAAADEIARAGTRDCLMTVEDTVLIPDGPETPAVAAAALAV